MLLTQFSESGRVRDPEEFEKVCLAGHSKVQMAVRCATKPPLNLRSPNPVGFAEPPQKQSPDLLGPVSFVTSLQQD